MVESTRLGPFEVVRRLGRGASGEVLEVRREGETRHLALKVLSRPDETARRRFEREAEVLARLRHAAIVPIHAAGLLPDGRAYLLMGLIEGSTLRARFRKGPLSPGETVQLGLELALALGHAHRQGIVHRDVKPENVLLDAAGQPRLSDFGLALEQGAERLTLTGHMCGTIAYAPPEQVRAGSIGPPADVWALGAVLYEALAGEPPFHSPEVPALVAQILRAEAPPLEKSRPDVGAPLAEVVARCLAKDPRQRWRDGEALALALARLGQRPRPRRGEGGLGVGASLLLGVALVAAALVVTLALGSAPDPAPSGSAPVASAAPSGSAASSVPAWFLRLPQTERPPLPLPAGLGFGAQPGEYLHDWDGSILVWVPAGTFSMGSDDLLRGSWGPLHRVTLTRGFWIGKLEVTWEQFRRYCALTGARRPEPEHEVGPTHPVHGVSHAEASAYCAWAGLRLPTEAEWEYAARGGDARLFPWGSDPPAGRVNMTGPEDGWSRSAPVGRFPSGASPFRCLDMAGNVSEWVQDWFLPYAEGEAVDPVASADPGQGPDSQRALRGGSWDSPEGFLRACSRERSRPHERMEIVGFRPAR